MSLRQEYKLAAVEVEVEKANGTDALKIVDWAINARDRRANNPNPTYYDEIWCVFDTENQTQSKNFKDAVEKANETKIKLAISNPAFEYWFLLHFTKTDASFSDYNDLEKVLKTHMANYNKTGKDFPIFFNKLFSKTEYALTNAKDCLEKHPDYPSNEYPNPCTHVHKLVSKLKDMRDFK